MNIEGKVWGNTSEIFHGNNVEVHRIFVNKGGYCSKHYHAAKFNSFFIESGKLKVKIWKKNYDLVDETILEPRQMTTVRPGEYHLFEALEDTVAYEIYWVELRQDDIVRDNVGGMENFRPQKREAQKPQL